MKKLIVAALVAMLAIEAKAIILTADSTQTGTVNCSANGGSPTLLFQSDFSAKRSYVINTSTSNIFIGFMSTTSTTSAAGFSISTSSGSFYIPASTGPWVGATIPTPNVWSPDGPSDSFTGPLWCVAQNGANTVQRIRMK